jgi:hypothetical protein
MGEQSDIGSLSVDEFTFSMSSTPFDAVLNESSYAQVPVTQQDASWVCHCNAQFTSRSNLRLHKRTHSMLAAGGGHTWACHCGAHFSKRDELRLHKKTCSVAQHGAVAAPVKPAVALAVRLDGDVSELAAKSARSWGCQGDAHFAKRDDLRLHKQTCAATATVWPDTHVSELGTSDAASVDPTGADPGAISEYDGDHVTALHIDSDLSNASGGVHDHPVESAQLQAPTKDRPYPCDRCRFRAVRKYDLKRHYRQVHKVDVSPDQGNSTVGDAHARRAQRRPATKERPYPCDRCTFRAAQRYGLKRHYRQVHKVDDNPDQSNSTVGDAHDRRPQHQPDAWFTCDLCAYGTMRKFDLKRHYRQVHKVGEEVVVNCYDPAPMGQDPVEEHHPVHPSIDNCDDTAPMGQDPVEEHHPVHPSIDNCDDTAPMGQDPVEDHHPVHPSIDNCDDTAPMGQDPVEEHHPVPSSIDTCDDPVPMGQDPVEEHHPVHPSIDTCDDTTPVGQDPVIHWAFPLPD